jgi:hypothetical protein
LLNDFNGAKHHLSDVDHRLLGALMEPIPARHGSRQIRCIALDLTAVIAGNRDDWRIVAVGYGEQPRAATGRAWRGCLDQSQVFRGWAGKRRDVEIIV